MNHLDFILDTKAVTEDGQIEGLAAGYGNIDAGGDVIVPGALARSLKGRTSVPMLMYHDHPHADAGFARLIQRGTASLTFIRT